MRTLTVTAVGAVALMAASVTACGGSTAASSPAASTAPAPATTASAAASSAVPAPTATTAGTTSDGGDGSHPCALVTPADARAALGTGVSTPHEVTVGLYTQCIYTPTSGSASLNVEVRSISQATFTTSVAKVSGGAKPLAGLGADAYVGDNALLVWKDGTELTILAVTVTGDGLSIEKKLAATAIGRM